MQRAPEAATSVWLGCLEKAHSNYSSEWGWGSGRRYRQRGDEQGSCRAFGAVGKTENFVLSQGRCMDA